MKQRALTRTLPLTLVFAAAVAGVACETSAQTARALRDPVRIESGLLSGVAGTSPGLRAYLGVPFAAAGRRPALARAAAGRRLAGRPRGGPLRAELRPERSRLEPAVDAGAHDRGE